MLVGSDDALENLAGASSCTFLCNGASKDPASLALNRVGKGLDHIRSARSLKISHGRFEG